MVILSNRLIIDIQEVWALEVLIAKITGGYIVGMFLII